MEYARDRFALRALNESDQPSAKSDASGSIRAAYANDIGIGPRCAFAGHR